MTSARVANRCGIPWIPWIFLELKSRFFRFFLEFFFNSGFFTINFLGYNIFGMPLFRSLICDNSLFHFCPKWLNNRPSQQVNCRPSQEPDVILKTDIFVGCPFIRCYHYWSISCFWEWKRTGAEIVPFVVMWLLLRVCNQCYMYFMSLLCYFSYFCLLLQSIWLIRCTSYLNSMKMTFGCL